MKKMGPTSETLFLEPQQLGQGFLELPRVILPVKRRGDARAGTAGAMGGRPGGPERSVRVFPGVLHPSHSI